MTYSQNFFLHVVCEGKSERNYLAALNRPLRDSGIGLTLLSPNPKKRDEDGGGFARYDVDGTGGEVELFPLEGENVTETLAERAEAAADGGCPLVGEFGEEQGDFVEGEGFFHDLFVFVVLRNGDLIAGIAVDDFSINSPLEGGADGEEVFAAGGSSYLGATVDYP